MIGTLKGTISYRQDPTVIIDVNGVGYRVYVSSVVLANIKKLGQSIMLYIHTHVREDLIELFGFTEPQDLKLFQCLINVSGIGCKTALNIFSIGTRQEIIHAITKEEISFFTGVPRLGRKNALKIIIELKGRLGGAGDIDLSNTGTEVEEVFAVLKNFGFSQEEARSALKALNGAGETVGEKVRLALKHLGK